MAVAQRKEAEEAPCRDESIEELFAAMESPLLAYAARLAPTHDMAQDLVQEAFVRLHAGFKEVRAPRSWLYRTVHNLAVNQLRGLQKIVPMIPPENDGAQELETMDLGPSPDEAMARAEGVALVQTNLKSLDARTREIIRLKFHEELSYAQISERTGLTVGNVGYILHHSLKSLAAGLSSAGLIP